VNFNYIKTYNFDFQRFVKAVTEMLELLMLSFAR